MLIVITNIIIFHNYSSFLHFFVILQNWPITVLFQYFKGLVINRFIKICFHFSWNNYWHFAFGGFEGGYGNKLKVQQAEHLHIALQKVDLFQEKLIADVWEDVVCKKISVVLQS